VLGGLMLLCGWWLPAGSAQAASYPPALGCAVSATTPAGGPIQVHGMGFTAGSRVLVSVAGRRLGAPVADPAGSFEASWSVKGLPPGGALVAADAGCSATGPGQQDPAEPVPPALPRDPIASAIPAVALTGLPPQMFLGLAGAVLLAGAALTGLVGRLGHRSEGRPTAASSVSGTVPAASGSA
jgi:hypothetical protein